MSTQVTVNGAPWGWCQVCGQSLYGTMHMCGGYWHYTPEQWGAASPTGWICPRCGKVWGPNVLGCTCDPE
jgi:hypothetical protein